MKQDRARRTHAAILVAARAVFAETGFDGARIDTIAERAGANKQRIYAYFVDKNGLFIAVQTEAIAALASYEEQVLSDVESDPRRLAEALLHAYMRFHREHPDFWRLLAWANLSQFALPSAASAHPRRQVIDRMRVVHQQALLVQAVPANLSFDAWFVTLTAVVYFLFSNQRTASVNLGLTLTGPGDIERLASECLSLLSRTPGNVQKRSGTTLSKRRSNR